MKNRALLEIVDHPFGLTKIQLENANKFLPPAVLASSATIVQVTSAYDQNIELVVTFSTAKPISGGVRRVAGQQIVNTNVLINFSQQLPLYWMASVLKEGDISPNQFYYIYSGDTDTFRMPLNNDITLTHEQHGWKIPRYDAEAYKVNVGFGLGLGEYISWGYSVPVGPHMALAMKAGSYDLVRSNGQEQIGDPVAPNAGDWPMPMGYTYTLAFDSCGNGTLTRQ